MLSEELIRALVRRKIKSKNNSKQLQEDLGRIRIRSTLEPGLINEIIKEKSIFTFKGITLEPKKGLDIKKAES